MDFSFSVLSVASVFNFGFWKKRHLLWLETTDEHGFTQILGAKENSQCRWVIPHLSEFHTGVKKF
jgi:hypothetical protein